MKVAFTTLGCRTNQNDTAEMQTVLQDEGFIIVDARDRADIYVINTCTVTAKSDAGSRQAVKKALAINADALVVFTGCYAQTQPEEAAALPGMDIVLGNANKLQIASVIKKKLDFFRREDDFGLPLIHMSDINSHWDFKPIPVSKFQGRTKAFIKVQTGCGEACTFCTVTWARGQSLSDSRDNVLNNVRQAIAAGYHEITLTGINLGTWGRDLSPPSTFTSLVEAVLTLPGDFRVRLSSINPMEIDDALVRLMAERPNLCPHLHIPLQSGCDSILERMRRNYRAADYRRVVEKAVATVPGLGLGADVIVGFPGETDAAFAATRRMVEDFPFTYLHVFSYSPRRGTDAFTFRNDIPKSIKKDRHRILTGLAHDKGLRLRRGLSGATVQVLVENTRDPESNRLRGHTEHYLPMTLEGPDSWMNRLVPVTVTGVTASGISGCLLSSP